MGDVRCQLLELEKAHALFIQSSRIYLKRRFAREASTSSQRTQIKRKKTHLAGNAPYWALRLSPAKWQVMVVRLYALIRNQPFLICSNLSRPLQPSSLAGFYDLGVQCRMAFHFSSTKCHLNHFEMRKCYNSSFVTFRLQLMQSVPLSWSACGTHRLLS